MTSPEDRPTSVRVRPHSKEIAYRLSIDLTPGAGRRLSIAEIVDAALVLADTHRDDVLGILTGQEVPS